jgi:D-threo-aldose 1-dehydrogenase
MTDPKLILLDESDNVLVCIAPIAQGDRLTVDDAVLQATAAVGVGHKIARRALRPGEKIVKYGVPIGSVTSAIAPGEWVHAHNMQSDYIPTHDRKTVAQGHTP